MRGWTSDYLMVIEDGDTLWTIADAAHFLGPPPGDPPQLPTADVITKLRILVRHHQLLTGGFQPVGKRRTAPRGHSGRYARVYAAEDFIQLYETMGATRQVPQIAA